TRPVVVTVPEPVRRELVEHARDEDPNEACGLLVLQDGTAERYVRGRNAAASPYRFELDIDPELWFLEDDGYQPAPFHSHPASPRPRRPRPPDVKTLAPWRAKPSLLSSVREGALAGWTISDGETQPLELA